MPRSTRILHVTKILRWSVALAYRPLDGHFQGKFIFSFGYYVMCKKLVASVDRFDKVVPLTEFLGEDNLSGKPLLVRFVNRSLDVISF